MTEPTKFAGLLERLCLGGWVSQEDGYLAAAAIRDLEAELARVSEERDELAAYIVQAYLQRKGQTDG